MSARRIEHWLREAYAASRGCPPPETFLASAMEQLSPSERKSVEEHAARCPACAGERDLARPFDAPADGLDVPREDVDYVVSVLRGAGWATDPRPGRGVPKESKGREAPRLRWHWGLAAAAAFAVVMVGTIATLRSPAPVLPRLTEDPTVRGSRLEVVRPVGELEALPATLEWKAVPGAARYHVRLSEVDDTVLFEETVTGVTAELPPRVLGSMHAAVVYSWQVEALGDGGTLLARSPAVSFRAKPTSGPSSSDEGGEQERALKR